MEQYDADNPGKYLTGMLSNTPDPVLEKAFRSFFSVVPTPPRGFKNFSVKVNEYMEKPPFKFPNPLVQLGGVKQVNDVRPPCVISVESTSSSAILVPRQRHSGFRAESLVYTYSLFSSSFADERTKRKFRPCFRSVFTRKTCPFLNGKRAGCYGCSGKKKIQNFSQSV